MVENNRVHRQQLRCANYAPPPSLSQMPRGWASPARYLQTRNALRHQLCAIRWRMPSTSSWILYWWRARYAVKSAAWVRRRLVPSASRSTIFGLPVFVATTQSTWVGGLVRSFDCGDDDLGVRTRPRQSHGDAYPLILAEMAGDFGQQKVVEQRHVLRPLIGCGDPPEAAQAEARDVIDVHGCIDDRLQPATLLLRRVRAVDDGHQLVAGALDESDRPLAWPVPRRGEPCPGGVNQQGGRSDHGHGGSACKHGAPPLSLCPIHHVA